MRSRFNSTPKAVIEARVAAEKRARPRHWLVEQEGSVQRAAMVARANIAIGDGAPGYWQAILDEIERS